jgi:hypothetical protein
MSNTQHTQASFDQLTENGSFDETRDSEDDSSETEDDTVYYHFDTAGFSHLGSEDRIEEKIDELTDENGLCELTQSGDAKQGTFGGDVYQTGAKSIEEFGDILRLINNVVSESVEITFNERSLVVGYESRGLNNVTIRLTQLNSLGKEHRKMICNEIQSDIRQVDCKIDTHSIEFENVGMARFVEDQTFESVIFEIPLNNLDYHKFGDGHYSLDVDLRSVHNKLRGVFSDYEQYFDYDIRTPDRINSGWKEGRYRSNTVKVRVEF